jgi:hypothetical protein
MTRFHTRCCHQIGHAASPCAVAVAVAVGVLGGGMSQGPRIWERAVGKKPWDMFSAQYSVDLASQTQHSNV